MADADRAGRTNVFAPATIGVDRSRAGQAGHNQRLPSQFDLLGYHSAMGNSVEEYGWGSSHGSQAADYLAPFVLDTLVRLRSQRVLDLGSGNGHLCGLISARGIDVVGIDFDRAGVEIAKNAHPHLNFYRYGVQDEPLDLLRDEAEFDVVVSTEVIEHLFSPHLLLDYASKVLSPSGHLILTTPYHGYLKNIAIAAAGKWDHHHNPLWHGGHIKFWSKATMGKLLEDNGFTLSEFHGLGRFPYLWKSMALVAQRRI